MRQYLELCQDILDNGFDRKNERTGEVTRSVFGRQLRFDLRKEFPIVKAKRIAFRVMIVELIWFLSGSTNIKFLTDNNCHIWNEWANEDGDLGPVYGKQWRSWNRYEVIRHSQFITYGGRTIANIEHQQTTKITPIDQIASVIHKLKTNPSDRRMLVIAYNPGEVDKMALPPCHYAFQFFVNNKNELSCMWNQRSVDTFLGLPFNIASYAVLTHMIAQVCNLQVGELIASLGDTHLYENHFNAVTEMLSRPLITEPAQLWLNPQVDDIDKFTITDIRLDNYKHHETIKAPIAV